MKKVNKPLYFYLLMFFSTTFIGAVLLYLPFTGKKSISFIDALLLHLVHLRLLVYLQLILEHNLIC